MLDVDGILRPWWDQLRADYGELALYDAHTHVGADDPDGFKQSPDELLRALERAGARAVVFPMHEPAGYPPANDRVMEAAARSDGRLSRTAASTRTTTRWRRRAAASTPARAASSSTRAQSSSRCRTRSCTSWWRSPTSGACRCSSTPGAGSRRSGATRSACPASSLTRG